MQVIRDPSDGPAGRCAVTIGCYDGIHLGHQAVIARTRDEARRHGAATAVVTFDRHPASVVRPASAPRLLTTLDQKLELLEALDVDHVFVVEFDEVRAAESAEDFAGEVLVGCLHATTVVVGADFHFGRGRAGDVAMLAEFGRAHDFETIGLDLVGRADADDGVVSSTAIRAAVAAGEVEAAARMLGRVPRAVGTVVHGDARGRTLGFPTANVAVPEPLLLPADGIYAAWYVRPDGTRHAAAVNVGRRPTFYADQPASLIEAFLLDFEGDLYGEDARVAFVRRLRPELRFDSVDALVERMHEDVAETRSVLGLLR
ncbi:MAG: bifunctional riboflavin kinase/FAD synthetase [Actinobacteria bacterium]|nr:bifunctional riboflavin kinase/FAD synthetase [Actinomycetota bacterium]